MDGTAAVGVTAKYAREDHIHPSDTSRELFITAGTTAQYWRGDKTWQTLDKAAVGLSNVDNTTDASKPISTATQTALNLKPNMYVSATVPAGAPDNSLWLNSNNGFLFVRYNDGNTTQWVGVAARTEAAV